MPLKPKRSSKKSTKKEAKNKEPKNVEAKKAEVVHEKKIVEKTETVVAQETITVKETVTVKKVELSEEEKKKNLPLSEKKELFNHFFNPLAVQLYEFVPWGTGWIYNSKKECLMKDVEKSQTYDEMIQIIEAFVTDYSPFKSLLKNGGQELFTKIQETFENFKRDYTPN